MNTPTKTEDSLDMITWTEDERTEYRKIAEQLTQHNKTLSSDEVDALSDNVVYAVVRLYRSHIHTMVAALDKERQRSTWQRFQEWFTKVR